MLGCRNAQDARSGAAAGPPRVRQRAGISPHGRTQGIVAGLNKVKRKRQSSFPVCKCGLTLEAPKGTEFIFSFYITALSVRAELLEAWLALTSVKYHDNILILMPLNHWLVLTMLQTTGPWLVMAIEDTTSQNDIISNFCQEKLTHFVNNIKSCHFFKQIWPLGKKFENLTKLSIKTLTSHVL